MEDRNRAMIGRGYTADFLTFERMMEGREYALCDLTLRKQQTQTQPQLYSRFSPLNMLTAKFRNNFLRLQLSQFHQDYLSNVFV